jgi:16S rRNA (guanine1516-N2)-methyltransferase
MSILARSVVIAVERDAAPTLAKRARLLAAELGLPFAANENAGELVLTVRADGLAIGPPDGRTTVAVDFLAGRTGYRRVNTGGKRQPLARALGIHKGTRRIIDATAGLGRDAFQLACIGCTVTAIERSAVLVAMLNEARTRGLDRGNAELRSILMRLTFARADAAEFLEELEIAQRPEAIYLDPMFPARNTSALAKKEMRIVRDLVGDDADAAGLLETARRVATKRVVVKRHPHAEPLARDLTASHAATRVRYDLYAPIK